MASAEVPCKYGEQQVSFLGIKVLSADCMEFDGKDWWIIKLNVAGEKVPDGTTGWAFLADDFTELKMERLPARDPPAMITGYVTPVTYENNALVDLLDQWCPRSLELLEDYVSSFLRKCLFCVRAVHSVADNQTIKRAVSYRYAKKTIPIGK
ncbi:hypothetical protein [Trichlorobacter lovleyi]|uniref:hypothetical protein n=1 Tax=Trichlorobacter lovleyi TaxID=313985 RepID=UPI0023F1A34A|nr:hypothetical protein [Trichlorobacter lovleyi]